MRRDEKMTNTQILVVEDESIVAKDIQNMLKNLGYDVPVVVFTGEDAVKKAAETHPDLILMDIKLKGNMDGVEAAKQIHDRFNIPVIYLTAYGDEKTLERAKLTEPCGYILKPFEERDLRTNIEIGLYKHKIDEVRIKNSAITPSINAIAIANLNGDFIYVNNSLLKMWGYDDDKEMLGKPMVKFWQTWSNTTEVLDELVENGRWMEELVAERKDGLLFDVQLSANMVTNKAGNPICVVASFVDITERRKTEGKAIRTKGHLHNIIDNISEIIISFDMNNQVTTWNKTAEHITRYKQKQVIGRHITKLDVFDNPQELLENLKSFSYGEKYGFDELILRTEDNNKRVIRASLSPIENNKNQVIGVLFVGKDITHNPIAHGESLKGNSYLISDKNSEYALDLFMHLTTLGYKGLFITRANPEMIKSTISSKDIQVLLLNRHKLGGFENIQDLGGLIAAIKEFSRRTTDSIILLDRVDYLITNFSFEEFVKSLYQINSIVAENKSILLFRLDPSLVDRRQMASIENEMSTLPNQRIEDVEIDDELYDILKYVSEQNQNNLIVSFKKVGKKFSIVSKTTTKRLRMLENKGLLSIKKQGRTKTVHVSKKGKTLLRNR